MKEIRAYVREERAGQVVDALAKAGFDFSVLPLRRIVPGLARGAYEYSVALGAEYEKIVKLEVVCKDDDVELLLALIQQEAHTGKRGDGMIFVAPIDDAVRISSGSRGEQALRDDRGSNH